MLIRLTLPAFASVTMALIATLATGLPVSALAEGTGLKLSFHAGWYAYREPGLSMRLDGPIAGLKAAWAPESLEGGQIDFEADLGSVDYRSAASGQLDGALRIRTSTTLLAGPLTPGWHPRLGLAFTTEWSDLRGLTTGGASGYQRFNRSLWLAAQWRVSLLSTVDQAATLQAGVLIAGWHDSYLSQVSALYGDVTNRQRRGLSIALDAPWRYEGWRGSLGLRVQRYDDSDLEFSPGLGGVYEPANRSFDIRLSVQC